MVGDLEQNGAPPNLSDRIVAALREEVISGARASGEQLPAEQEIADQFQASLPTVKSALRRLVAENFIYSRRGPKGGHFVNRPSVENANRLAGGATMWLVRSGMISLTDLLEARRILGGAIVRLAAQRRTNTDLIRIEQAVLKMGNSSLSNHVFCAAEIQFSRLLATASGNPLLVLLNLLATGAFASGIRQKVFSFEERERIVQLSGAVLAGLGTRQADIGEARIGNLNDFLRDILLSGAAADPGVHQGRSLTEAGRQ